MSDVKEIRTIISRTNFPWLCSLKNVNKHALEGRDWSWLLPKLQSSTSIRYVKDHLARNHMTAYVCFSNQWIETRYQTAITSYLPNSGVSKNVPPLAEDWRSMISYLHPNIARRILQLSYDKKKDNQKSSTVQWKICNFILVCH